MPDPQGTGVDELSLSDQLRVSNGLAEFREDTHA
jgi:hypothetical protein